MNRRAVIAVLGGNSLEWYDFVVYAALAPLLSKAFFPKADDETGLILTFSVFAVGYLSRPLGGLLIGYLGDRLGRRRALVLSISLMAVPTAAIGLLPTHAQIGEAAPLMLSGLRLLQGFAVGGEFPSAMTYLTETARRKRRGLHGSLAMFGVLVGLLIANLVTLGTTSLLSPEDMAAWGWRIPFLFAVVMAAVVFRLRIGLEETQLFLQTHESRPARRNPVVSALTESPRQIVQLFFFLTFNAIAFNTIVMFSVTYLSRTAGFEYRSALTISIIGICSMLFLVPLGGYVSDRIGRRRTTGISAFAALVLALPLYLAMNQGEFALALVAQVIFVVVLAMHVGPVPSLIAEQFSTAHRLTGAAIAFNLNVSLIGGTAPLLNEVLLKQSGWAEAPGLLLMGGAAVSLIALLFLNETARRGLGSRLPH